MIKNLPEKRYYTIGEVAKAFKVNTSLLRFWETEFKDGIWIGEDVKFCDLVEKAGFKFHAIVDGETTHYGTMGYKGKLVDTFKKSNGKAD